MVENLKVDPSTSANMIEAAIGSIKQNPYRDMVMFPIQADKIESLVESIEDTGFWPSIIARPVDNEIDGKVITQAELNELIANGYDFSDTQWEKAFGHHRQAACEAIGYQNILIIPQIISDEKMLLMMANENKEGFGSNINSTLETVRQVKVKLESSIADFDTYEEYCAAVGDEPFFDTSKKFKAAQNSGVGFRTVQRFLGKTWPVRTVRAPMMVLKAVEDGLYHQEDIVNVPSMGLLEGISTIARIVYEGYTPQKKDAEAVPAPNWPLYFKEEAINAVIERCQLNDKKHNATVTVGQLEKAATALRTNGVNPASYLRSGKGKTAFDVYEATKDFVLVADKDLDYNMAAISDLPNIDGFAEYDGLSELMDKLKAAAERLAKGEEEPVEGGGLEPTTEGDVDAALHGEDDTVEGGDTDAFGDIAPEGVDMPINQLVTTLASDAEIIGSKMASVARRIDEVEMDDTFRHAIIDLLSNAAGLVHAALGKSVLIEVLNEVARPTTEAEVTEAEVASDEALGSAE